MRLSPVRIALLYAGVAGLWILFSDSIAQAIFTSAGAQTTVSIIKGWAFVAVTSMLLFLLVRRLVQQVLHARLEAFLAADRARRLIDASGIAIVALDAEGTVVAWNPSAERMFGWTAAEAIGRTAVWVPEDELASHRDFIATVAAGARPGPIVRPRKRKDGRRIWARIVASTMQDADGKTLVIGSIEDVTAQIDADRERAAAERRRQALLDRLEALHTLDAEILQAGTLEDVARRAVARIRTLIPADRASVMVMDRNSDTMTIVAVDEETELGLPVGTIASVAETFALDGREPAGRALLRDLAADEPPADAPVAVRRARSFGLRSVLSIPLLADGALLGQLNLGSQRADAFDPGAVEVAGEVADSLAIALQQARYRQELVDGEARFRTVLAASPNATLLVDSGGLIRYANAITAQTLGQAPDALLGRSIDEFVPLAGHARSVALRPPDPSTDPIEPGTHVDATARRGDGVEFPIDLSLSPLVTPEGPMVVATIVDLTERIALENQFRQAQKMEVMGQFANIMAHDFRNYLTAIGGFAEILAADIPGDDPRHADVEEIIKAVGRASDLVRNVLAFARPDRGAAPASTDVGAHLRDVRAMLAKLVDPNVDLVLVVPSDVPPAAISPAALTQVLVNLTTNARDAMLASGGTLRICASTVEVAAGDPGTPEFQLDRRVHLEVSDTGAGMDEVTRIRIFEPFFTTKSAGEGDGKGSGLGLASVFSIVRRAHGRIEVRSEVGAGTSFLIDLPAA